MKKALLIIVIILAVAAAALGIGGYFYYNHYKDDPAFLDKTTFNGGSVAGLTPEDVAKEAAAKYDPSKTRVEILENGTVQIEGTMEEFGYTFDEGALLEFLTECRDEQRESIIDLIGSQMNGFSMTAESSFLFDPGAIPSLVSSDKLAVKRVKTKDNELVYDSGSNRYHVETGSEGNEIDDSALQKLVADALDKAVNEPVLPEKITVEFTKELYTSLPPAGDLTAMKNECDEKNLALAKEEIIDGYRDFSITYQFGDETDVLDFSILEGWIEVNDDLQVVVSDASIDNYVSWLKEEFDTVYLDRSFTTSSGDVIVIPASENDYGYSIDYLAECEQLKNDILSGESVSREPLYVELNEFGNPYYFSRNGKDDLNGTYVEIDLTKQHLWYYRYGELITDCDIVSGSVAKKAETQTGAFPLAFMESPMTLTGADADGSGGYSVEVQYWMPFFNGQGLHDAGFRSEFGGSIYRNNGSHGCVNLPPAAAEQIYENIEPGVPIVIYKS